MDSSGSARDLPRQRAVTWKQGDVDCFDAAAGRHLLRAYNVPGAVLNKLLTHSVTLNPYNEFKRHYYSPPMRKLRLRG